MNFKESKAIYLQIADRICDEVLLGNTGKTNAYHRSENMQLWWKLMPIPLCARTTTCNRKESSTTSVASATLFHPAHPN